MAKRLIVTGRVQGVGYRDWVCGQAERLALRGWVRNRRDGSVEAVVEGDDTAVQAMIAAARRGPPAARVDSVAVDDAGDGPFADFRRLPTG